MFKDLLHETVEYYKEHPRAVNDVGACVYLSEKAARCAVGRLLTDSSVELLKAYGLNSCSAGRALRQTYTELRPEYQWLNVRERFHEDFLEMLQDLHDTHTNWNKDNTLSYRGLEHVARIEWEISKYEAGAR